MVGDGRDSERDDVQPILAVDVGVGGGTRALLLVPEV